MNGFPLVARLKAEVLYEFIEGFCAIGVEFVGTLGPKLGLFWFVQCKEVFDNHVVRIPDLFVPAAEFDALLVVFIGLFVLVEAAVRLCEIKMGAVVFGLLF